MADLGIPAFAAISGRLGGTTEDIVLGFGAHLDAKIALKRAMAELNQMLCVAEAREAEEGDLNEPELEAWLETATVANQSHLSPDDAAGLRRAQDYPEFASDDFLTDISTCRRSVEDRGMEMLALDQTRPDIGLPVAKVIVPGLRHFWARFAPGRLYDVPVALGWREEPLREDELNPIPFFL